MRISMIIRPREGSVGLAELRGHVAALRDRGHEVRPRLTFEAGDAERMARSAARSGADLIVAAGGDGTVNEVVNGVLRADWAGRLAVVPTGTANDFAFGLGIPSALADALEVAVRGRARAVDVGRVNRRYFVNMSTGGFGAAATEETPSDAKRLLGPWAYLITGARQFSDLRPSRVRFETPDGVAYEGETLLFAVGNGTQTGGGTVLTPEADPGDGQLDILIVPGLSRMEFAALLPDLRSGKHRGREELFHFRTEALDVTSEEPLSVNADGEPLSGSRFRYSVADRRLTLMTPG